MTARDRWNARYTDRAEIGEPAPFVCEIAELLEPGATVVDLAGGTGRHALWLAGQGHPATLVDVSSVALDAAAEAAREAGLSLETIERDLEADGLPLERSWALVLMHYYFDPTVVRAAWGAVRPGGLLAVAQPTVTNLERHERPSRRFLLEVGQIAELADELAASASAESSPSDIVTCTEGWRDNDRHEGRLVLRRGPAGSRAD
ncbi:MAG: class I SAM-dependent methyltransferase [Acidimicrobiales bacterium]